MAEEVKMVKTLINGDFEIILPEHRAARPEWDPKRGGWEKRRLRSMRQLLSSQDTVIYVGAEEGEMPALCSMWGAEVVLVEPNEKVWPNIRAIWEANKLKHPLGFFEGFASNKTTISTKVGLMTSWPSSAYGKVIGDHGFKQLMDAGNIPQIKIDDMGVKPTAIILDVEGSEWRVLEGAEKTLRLHKPKIWLSGHPEFMFAQYAEYLGDLRKWIRDFGYTELLLDYRHEVHLLYAPEINNG